MFFKKSKLAKRTYLALSLTTAMVAVYQPSFAAADSFGSKIVDAVEANSAEQVKALLDKGINPNERGQFGTSALLRAANNGNLEIAKILLSGGANANVADLGGATALHIAARKGDYALAEFLLKNKADVNLADKEGNTALMLAAISGSQTVVNALISAGAEVDATNNSGETALLYATDNSAEKIVDALVAAGAKNDVVDEEGFSIREVAQRKNNEVLVAKLDARDSNHVVIEMGRGFRSISSVEKERAEERTRGEQLIAQLDERDLVDYNAEFALEPSGNIDFIDDPELAMLDTPNFAQIEPASGDISGKAEPKSSWLSGLKKSFDSVGAFELASVKNFAEGTKYTILEMGSFKVKAFAEKRISELQMDNMDVLGNVQLVIFERGTGADLEYVVNGGIFETRAEADGICQKLTAKGVRCNPVETAMITNDQFAKFNAPVKSAFSAPAIEKTEIGAGADSVKIPELPKTDIIKAAETPAGPVKTLAKVEAKAAPALDAVKPELPKVPALKPLAKVEAKPELKPSFPVVDAKSIAANSVPASAPTPTVVPEKLSVKSEEKSTVSSIVDSIYSEKEAAKTPALAPAVKVIPENVAVVKAVPEKLEEIADVKKQIESLPMLEAKTAPAAVALPKLETKLAAEPTPAAKEPMKIVFAEPKIESMQAEPAKIIAPVTPKPVVVNAEKSDEFKIVNQATAKPEMIKNSPAPAPKVLVEKFVIPAAAAPATPAIKVAEPAPAPAPVLPKVVAEIATAPVDKAAPADKFIVAKPVRVDDARAIAAAPTLAPQPKVMAEPAYANAAPAVAYESAYIPPLPTFNRRENRRMAQVDFFATPTAAQGLYWKYRQAGMLADYTTVRATKGLLNGVHYSALIGEFSSSAEAQAFCNAVYKAEKLRCKVQDELDYTSSPKQIGTAKSYQRHSNYSARNAGLSRHNSR